MPIYLALLRGINVGGNRKVAMAKLRQTFEELGLENVRSLIASGNVIFSSDIKNRSELLKLLESAIEKDFGFRVDVLIHDLAEVEKLVKAIPRAWVNDKQTKCDVIFLWPSVDSSKILAKLPANQEIEDVKYVPGAVLWRLDREKASKSRIPKIVGTPLYKQMTIRNPNTVRRIYQIMSENKNN